MATLFKDSLYTSVPVFLEESKAKFHLRFNQDHPIYDGHFPGNPITPGVCSVQIIAELMAECWSKKPTLLEIGNVKFTKFIDPRLQEALYCNLSWRDGEKGRQVTASISSDVDTYVKYRAVYTS